MANASLSMTAEQSSRERLYLRALSWWYRIRRLAFSRINGGVRRMWAARVGFYQSMWKSACEATGTDLSIGANGEIEMRREGLCLKARDNNVFVDDASAIRRVGDKRLVHRVLTDAGIPVPRHAVVTIGEFERALSCLQEIGPPVVVKPMAFTGGGFGVTTNVFTAKQLGAAMAWAHPFDSNILIEEQAEGDVYRILLMDGEIIDAIRRRPPSVVGDGKSTIGRLLRQENRRRVEEGARRSQALIATDKDLINTLACQGLTMSSQPPFGSVVRLKQVINDNAIQDNEPAGALLCPEIAAAARTAADLVGLRLAGVDVICRDPSLPLASGSGVILEVNAPPNFYYHHLEGRDMSIATRILQIYFGCRTKAEQQSGVVAQTDGPAGVFPPHWRSQEP